jgi:hypothetical protein
MGLVQNLKKILSNLVDKILVELSYHYIKQRAKQILRRPDDSSPIMSSSNPLTTENQPSTIATFSTDTSEKIIMETTIEPVVQIRDWSIDRIHHLADTGNIEQQLNAVAIAEEFDEWINLPEGDNELDYLCLEREEGFGDQEIDVR